MPPPSPAYSRLRQILHELERPWARRGLPVTLTAAAMAGDLETMEAFVERGTDVDERTRGFTSPLQAAASAGRTESVRWLLERGADPDKAGTYTALGSAIERGDPEMVRLLLAAGARVDALHTAERRRLAALLGGEPVAARAPGAEARPAPAGDRPAVERRHPESRGEEAGRLVEEALDLIRNGDLDSDLDRLGHHGESLLTACVREGLTSLALALLERGADPDAGRPDAGSRALIQAVENGEWEVFDTLLGRGADVDAEDHLGCTALMAAADFGLLSVVERLLALGADPARKGRGGQTAVNQAQGPHRKEIQKVLRAAVRARRDAPVGSLRVEGRGAVRGVAARRGVRDFLDLVFAGEPDWCLLAARADVGEVSPVLAALRSAARLEIDVARREVEPGERASFVLQLAGHPFSVEVRSVFSLFHDDVESLAGEAAELSRHLGKEVLTFVGSDTSGTCNVTRYRDGVDVESAEWTLDGELLAFRSEIGTARPSAGRGTEAIEVYFRGIDLYLPPCSPGGGGERAELILHGIGPKTVARVDVLVLDEG